MTNDGQKTYAYDAVGRMTSINGGALGAYGYNGDGKRVKKVEGGATTYYVNSAVLGSAAFELNDTGAVNRVHVTAGGKEIAQLATDGGFYWLHTDHLGTPRRMTNSNGVVMFRGEYDPHGNPLLEWTTISNGKFTGYERDAAAGLDFAQARHYKFGRGRFMQPDPAGLDGADMRIPQSLNRYGYVINDPINLIDKSGMFYGSPWCTSIYWNGLFMGGNCSGGIGYGMFLDMPLIPFEESGGGNPQPWEAPEITTCTITLGARHLDYGLLPISKIYHAYVTTAQYSTIPELNKPIPTAFQGQHIGDNIRAAENDFKPGNEDYDQSQPNPNDPMQLGSPPISAWYVISGTCDQINANMRDTVSKINAANLTYQVALPGNTTAANSNAVAYTLLENSGHRQILESIFLAKAKATEMRWMAPGWGRKLP